jgi:hypothetical protein
MPDEDHARQQLIDARRQQMSESLQRLWRLKLGERPPATILRLDPGPNKRT